MHNEVLASFNISQADLLGQGGEAQVYALDDTRVIRLFGQGTSVESVTARTRLLAEIAAGSTHLPFETPVVFEQGVSFGQIYTIEKRIPGTSLLAALSHAQGDTRLRLIEQYMKAAWQLGDIRITRPFFGEIDRDEAIQTSTWQAYLTQRARHSLAVSPKAQSSLTQSPLTQVDVDALVASITKLVDTPTFVHLDYFAGNVMVNGDQLTAVIDFGYASIMGDRRMNSLVAATHLVTPRITPTVTAEDQALAFAWLREHELFDYYERGVPWLAAYWTFASDDVALYEWCRSILT